MKKNLMIRVLSALLCFGLMATALAASNARLGYINGSDVCLREEANTQSQKLLLLDKNTKVLILESSGTFFKLKVDGKTGYASDEFVTVYSAKDGLVFTNDVNFRQKATTDSSVISSLSTGDQVNIYGEDGEFFLATYGNAMGYIHSSLVQLISKTESSSKAYARSVENTGTYTDAEIEMIARVVYAESGKDNDGYKAVASVIYNRIQSSKYPNTVFEVLFQEGQFSVVDDIDSINPSDKAYEAVKSVFIDGILTVPSDVMYFRNERSEKKWGSRNYYATIGGNMFYS